MDLSKYRQLFLDESREHLQVMNRELLRLEQEGETGGVDALFRAAHSIKGMSGSMGYDAVVAVSHALEDILDRLRKKTIGVDPGLMTLLYEGVDALGALVAEIDEKGATHLEVAGLAARLRAASQREPSDAGAPRRARDAGLAARRHPARRGTRGSGGRGRAGRGPRCRPGCRPAASSPWSRRSSRWSVTSCAAASSPTPATFAFRTTRRRFAHGTSSSSAASRRRNGARFSPTIERCAPASAAKWSRRCC